MAEKVKASLAEWRESKVLLWDGATAGSATISRPTLMKNVDGVGGNDRPVTPDEALRGASVRLDPGNVRPFNLSPSKLLAVARCMALPGFRDRVTLLARKIAEANERLGVSAMVGRMSPDEWDPFEDAAPGDE